MLDEDGSVLAKGRVPEGIEVVAWLHETVASHAGEPSEVIVGIEGDRGLLVGALMAAGYSVRAINPLSVSRYRDRHRVSGAKSDPGNARVLADLVRTDRHLDREGVRRLIIPSTAVLLREELPSLGDRNLQALLRGLLLVPLADQGLRFLRRRASILVMTRPTLSGCWAKLDRAKEQLDTLNEELGDYVESKPYDISQEPYERKPWLIFTYEGVPEAPARYGVIVGEIVHDLRSSLDHLVWQLVRLNGGVRKRQYFPVCDRWKPRGRGVPGSYYWSREAGSSLLHVHPDHRAVIKGAQPAKDGRRARNHPLWLLHSLWNTDKHRVVHGAFFDVPEETPGRVSVDVGGFSQVGIEIRTFPGRVKEGADALAVSFRSAWGRPQYVDVEVHPPVRIGFGDRGVIPRRLHEIGEFISREVLAQFTADFGWDSHPTGAERPFHEPLPPPEPGLTFATGRPEETRKRFSGWKVWFDVGRWQMPTPSSPIKVTNPAWYLQSPSGLLLEFDAVGRTVEDLETWWLQYVPHEVLGELRDWFRPMERQTEPTLGVIVTPGD